MTMPLFPFKSKSIVTRDEDYEIYGLFKREYELEFSVDLKWLIFKQFKIFFRSVPV